MISSLFQRGFFSSFLVSPADPTRWSLATRSRIGRAILAMGLILSLAILGGWASVARAAESQLVGILATAVRPDVARELQLEAETIERLKALIAQQKAQAEGLVISGGDAKGADAQVNLEAFAGDSQRHGLELLSRVQQQRLHQILICDQGMQSLRDAAVAKSLELTPVQRTQIEQQW